CESKGGEPQLALLSPKVMPNLGRSRLTKQESKGRSAKCSFPSTWSRAIWNRPTSCLAQPTTSTPMHTKTLLGTRTRNREKQKSWALSITTGQAKLVNDLALNQNRPRGGREAFHHAVWVAHVETRRPHQRRLMPC